MNNTVINGIKKERLKTLARHCYYCQSIFWVRPIDLKDGRGKYCSQCCFQKCDHPNYGKPANKKQLRALLSFANGPRSAQHCANISKGLRGKFTGAKNPRWKGGMTDLRHTFYNMTEMSRWRKEVLRRGNYKCVECGEQDNLDCHHLHSAFTFQEIAFYPENGIVLCEPCHYKFHFR